jgi:glycogen synthase
MLGWEYPPYGTGGLAPATAGVVSGLLANGIDVVLHLPVSRGIAGRTGLTVLGANANVGDVPSVYEFGSGTPARDFFHMVRRYAVQARRAARDLRFDVIHAHDWLTALAASAIAADSGRPWIWHVHATEFDRAGEYGDVRVVDVERRAVREADLIIAVSQYTRDILIRRYGADPARVHVVHNSVDLTPGATPRVDGEREHRPLVLFLGRMTFQKGPDYFVEAARWVLSRRPDVLFVLAGDGDMRPRLMEHVAGLEIGASIVFAGLVTPEEAKRLFAMADVFVMPSVSEPFGLTALEAIRAGTPVIVSRNAGVREVARDVLEVDFWDVRQVADRIIAALEHAHLRETLTERSHASMERWSWTQAGARIAGLYDLLLAKGA